MLWLGSCGSGRDVRLRSLRDFLIGRIRVVCVDPEPGTRTSEWKLYEGRGWLNIRTLNSKNSSSWNGLPWGEQPRSARRSLSEGPSQEFGTQDSCLRWATVPGECFSVFSPRRTSPANKVVRVQGNFCSHPHQLSGTMSAHLLNSD